MTTTTTTDTQVACLASLADVADRAAELDCLIVDRGSTLPDADLAGVLACAESCRALLDHARGLVPGEGAEG
jgi:hypothetical protein